MGLCKCPKRQVTNQFCFEHRVNVCEHCMVQSHPKCIVQSYLQWLRDSDYISNCTLCGNSLEQGDCVRLVCYHVYHWDCLNARQSALPANTAPHGHTCPMCETEIFPTSNLVSPVADALKVFLSAVNWGRNGLGLALLSEDKLQTPFNGNNTIAPKTGLSSINKLHNAPSLERSNHNIEGNLGTSSKRHESPHSVLLMDAFNLPPEHDMHANSRRPLLPRQQPIGGSDRDENKYKRRTPAEIFSRWSRRFYAPSSRPPWRRTWFYVLSGIVVFLFIIYIMAALGRGGNSDRNYDDNYDNPNQNSHLD